MDEWEYCGGYFKGIKPGWIYDERSQKMITVNNTPSQNTSLHWNEVSVRHKFLKELIDEKKSWLGDYVWQDEFQKSHKNNCFVMKYIGTYSSTIIAPQEPVPYGIVTEVKFQRSILILVCTDDVNSYDACSAFIGKLLEEKEAVLDDSTCLACKKSSIYYDRFNVKGSNSKSFKSIVACLKEVARIINEMKNLENFIEWKWKYSKDRPEADGGLRNINHCPLSSQINSESLLHLSKVLNSRSSDASQDPNVKSQEVPNTCDNIPKCESEPNNVNTESCSTCIEVEKRDENKASLKAAEFNEKQNFNECDFVATPNCIYFNFVKSVDEKKTNSMTTEDKQYYSKISVVNSVCESTTTCRSIEQSCENIVNIPIAPARQKLAGNDNGYIETKSNQHLALKATAKQDNTVVNASIANSLNNSDLHSVKETQIGDRLRSSNPVNKRSNSAHPLNPAKKECISNRNSICYNGKKISINKSYLNGIRYFEIGNNSEVEGKTLLLLGATGSGKSAIVNLCANYYFGAKTADEEKLFIAESKIKTDRVTVYTFYPEVENQIPLTVVDTPGLNDSTGAEIHDHVDALKSFLALACTHGLKINAICFVAQAHLVRLTSSEKLVMDFVKSLFGSEVEKHIMVLVTFSDNQPTPPVIEAMEHYGFTSPFFAKFNNTLLISKTEVIDDLDKIYWRTGLRSWKKCLKHLITMDSLPNGAISSVQSDVINRSFLFSHNNSLKSQITAFSAMIYKKKSLKDVYCDENICEQRRKVWLTSNLSFNLECGVNKCNETKEMFLLRAAQGSLRGNNTSLNILLFLMLDSESSFFSFIFPVVNFVLQCERLFWMVGKSKKETFLVMDCIQCEKQCFFERSDSHLIKLECKCGCPGGIHCSLENSNSHSQPSRGMTSVLNAVALHIKTEISKYHAINISWTVSQLFYHLQYIFPNVNDLIRLGRELELA